MSDRRPKPTPPTIFPVLFLSCAILMVFAYLALQQLGYAPGYVLLLAPLLLPLLPAEIKYALDRRRICADIITDFVSRAPEVDTDYERIMAGLRGPGMARQTVNTDEDDSQGPVSWR